MIRTKRRVRESIFIDKKLYELFTSQTWKELDKISIMESILMGLIRHVGFIIALIEDCKPESEVLEFSKNFLNNIAIEGRLRVQEEKRVCDEQGFE